MVVYLDDFTKWSLINGFYNLISICDMISNLVFIKLIWASIISISLLVSSTWYKYTLIILFFIESMILLLFIIISIISFSCTFWLTINRVINLNSLPIFNLSQEVNPLIFFYLINLFSREMGIILINNILPIGCSLILSISFLSIEFQLFYLNLLVLLLIIVKRSLLLWIFLLFLSTNITLTLLQTLFIFKVIFTTLFIRFLTLIIRIFITIYSIFLFIFSWYRLFFLHLYHLLLSLKFLWILFYRRSFIHSLLSINFSRHR